jgi:hypothetical protein
MQGLIDFIFNGAEEFTPQALVAYMSFVLVLSAICSIVESMFTLRRGC